MKTAHLSFDEIFAVLRRRKIPLLLPIVLVTAICTLGAFMLPRRYESSTTILVQGQGVLNPLVNYTMAVSMQSDDRLKDFNEIVYSIPTIEALIDSLGIRNSARTEEEKQRLIKTITSNIKTERNGSESFSISYLAESPLRAQRAVSVLAQLFIETRLRIENSKNDFAVQFFTERLNALRGKFEQSQDQLVGTLKQHAVSLPEADRAVYAHIDDYDKQVDALQKTISDYGQALTILRAQLAPGNATLDLKALYEIPLLGVPFAENLQSALAKLDDLQHHYTPQYPAVQDQRDLVVQLLQRTMGVVESDLRAKQSQIWAIEKQRNSAIETVQQATVARNQDQDIQSNFSIYKELYNDMKIKLEQAQTSRDLGETGAREFVVIDPPQLPTSAAKPNKPLMVAGGFSLGLILGLFAAGLAEVLDSTIRTPEDVELYRKPIIAYVQRLESVHKQSRG